MTSVPAVVVAAATTGVVAAVVAEAAVTHAWKDNLANVAVLLRSAPRRFVFARAHANAGRAATLRIPVKPNRGGGLLVAHHRYRITLRLWVTYTPTGGHPHSIGYYGLHLP